MEIYLSFVIGTLLTLLFVYAERAYSESFPKQTKTIEDVKRETIAVFCKMKTPQARLEVLSKTLEFKREILHTIFEPDNPDFIQLDYDLRNLIDLVNSNVIKYRR